MHGPFFSLSAVFRRNKKKKFLLLQHILDEFFLKMMQSVFQKDVKAQKAPEGKVTEVTENNEQVLRYCVGYIPLKLLRRYKKMKKTETSKVFIDTLDSWKASNDIQSDNFEDYTQQWLQKQERGGLFHINDMFLHF